jgi:hypothetical protein
MVTVSFRDTAIAGQRARERVGMELGLEVRGQLPDPGEGSSRRVGPQPDVAGDYLETASLTFDVASFTCSPASLNAALTWSDLPFRSSFLLPVILPAVSFTLPLMSCALFDALSGPWRASFRYRHDESCSGSHRRRSGRHRFLDVGGSTSSAASQEKHDDDDDEDHDDGANPYVHEYSIAPVRVAGQRLKSPCSAPRM